MLHEGSHQAMKCLWRFFLHEPDLEKNNAEYIFQTLQQELERLEQELSRFQAGSDIWKINQLKQGETTRVYEAAWDCLQLAQDITAATNGAFDISSGAWIELYRHCAKYHTLPPEELIEKLRPAVGPQAWSTSQEDHKRLVHCHHDDLLLDLGALGKGYALDQLACRLETEFQLKNFLLLSGESTILASGNAPQTKGWPINAGTETIYLQNEAISTSGADTQGGHILDPRTGTPIALRRSTVHAFAPQAAVADALSTTCFVLSPQEAKDLVSAHPDVRILFPEESK